ncbi:hypothetical protein ABIF53_000249, partial [Bradyrhizobium japonicum]
KAVGIDPDGLFSLGLFVRRKTIEASISVVART